MIRALGYCLVAICMVLGSTAVAEEYGVRGRRTQPFSINTAPDKSFKWVTAPGSSFKVEWSYLPGYSSGATLEVSGERGFNESYTTSGSSQLLELPAGEDLYTLTLTTGFRVQHARVAVVNTVGSSSTTIRCVFSEPDKKPWNRAYPFNLLPVLYGATELIINNESLASWSEGAACQWYGWSAPATKDDTPHALSLVPMGSAELFRMQESLRILLK